MSKSISSANPLESLPAHCLACQHRFRVPLGATAQLFCPKCGSDQIVDHNVEPVAVTRGIFRVERGGHVYTILSDAREPMAEEADPVVVAVLGEDISSPEDPGETYANAILFANAKLLRQSVEDLLSVVAPDGALLFCECPLCAAVRGARAVLAMAARSGEVRA